MAKKSYLQDILDQPVYLRSALRSFPINEIDSLLKRLRAGEFKKIILTGHGSSYNSLYPAFLHFCSQSIPVALWQTAEILHYGINQIDSGTLLIANSQSGKSAEVKNLMRKIINNRPACLLSLTNDLKSDLGKNSDIKIDLLAGEEHGVATKTYINSLSLSSLLSVHLCGENMNDAMKDMQSACDAMEEYLTNWQTRIVEIDSMIGKIQNTVIIGRGPSMATALNGALNQKEAAWLFTEGMNAAEFRHGPMELVDSNMTLIIIEGDQKTSKLNSVLAKEVAQYGGKVIWIGNNPPSIIASIKIPDVADFAKPMVEVLPLQLFAYVLANRQKIQAGNFRHIGKVVLKE
jgi:glucosamine--fructose-6-phosphate aminotransferase (isomerizing)